MAGSQGGQPGPCSAPWLLPRFVGAAARLAAGAGCAGCWHKPPPADGVKRWWLLRNLWASPRVRRGGLSTGTKFQPCGRRSGQESNLLQTSCEVALPMSYQRWQAGSRTRHLLLRGVTGTLPIPSACGVRHARNQQSPETPYFWHRWGEPLFKPQPVSGHRLRWMSSLLPDVCQLILCARKFL